MDMYRRLLALAVVAVVVVGAIGAPLAAPVRVRFMEGAAHGFLLLREGETKTLAEGDWWQIPDGDRVEVNLRFRFHDGSLAHETYVMAQRRAFTLLSYKVVQRGPIFPKQFEASLDAQSGRYTVRHRDAGASADTVDSGEMDVPDDLYGLGVGAILLRNLEASEGLSAHVLVFTPKPRVVSLRATPAGEETFTLGDQRRTARRYVGHLELGGLLGAAATVAGKQPPDVHWWMAGEPVSTFVRFEGPLYANGPVWRIDFVGPRWKH